MAEEGALLGITFLKARTGNEIDFDETERSLLWHAADTLLSIKNKFVALDHSFDEPSTMGHLERYIDGLFEFSENGSTSTKTSYKEDEMITYYLDRMYECSGKNSEIERMINQYSQNTEYGLAVLQEYFDSCEAFKKEIGSLKL